MKQDQGYRQALNKRLELLILVNDVVISATAIILAYWIQAFIAGDMSGLADLRAWNYRAGVVLVVAVWMVAFYAAGLYQIRRFISSLGDMTGTVRGVTIVAVLVGVVGLASETYYTAPVLLLFWLAALPLAVASRAVLRGYARRARSRTGATTRTLIVGSGDVAGRVVQRLQSYRLDDYEVIGFVSVGDRARAPQISRLLGTIEHLSQIVQRCRIHEVVVAEPQMSSEQLMSVVEVCRDLDVNLQIVASPVQLFVKRTRMSALADLPVLQLPHPQSPAWQRAARRIGDIVLSALLLLVSLPVMLPIIVMVRRETGGSGIFKQTRIGYRGEPFTIYKFRTMCVSADPYAEPPEDESDERTGPIGRWLRRTSLDELPQLVNIIIGDMSIVGPRPEMPQFVEQYRPWQRRRLDVKPGLTGLWQIFGRKDLPLRHNIEYDLFYILNWSIWLDMVIILRTIPVVFTGRGAY